MQRFILTLRCDDRAGIVLAGAQAIVEVQGNIVESDQFSDPPTGLFCMRIGFDSPLDVNVVRESLVSRMSEFAPLLDVRAASRRRRVLVMVSKIDHCLEDLLYRWSNAELVVEIPLIVSNHPDCARVAERYGVPFVHVPVGPSAKLNPHDELVSLIIEHEIDFVVLARYMQVLPAEFCDAMAGRIINIHHSFLPGFKGAKPYHQAYERGVKLIGATAHYVTSELDEGPIIEQAVVRVTHAQSVSDLIALGRDIERSVLARAVRLQSEDRVVLAGARTIVFAN
ncbi:MAG: formyltetrahydrofolate deformylase [Acidimicrobiales bacterium]